jgi:uncharacterized 2Fe-2S/4Fe-4S cluster protein (DUF4445 family)
MNEIIGSLVIKQGIRRNEIYEATIVGNTTMSHIVLGVEPGQLAMAPFAPVFTMAVEQPACMLGLDINPFANVHLLPNIAGHVGSDITGVLLATRITGLEGLNLALDIGTNGEIILSREGTVLVCSTAAGPAFEGAEIYQGMRAAEGAIEGVSIREGSVGLSVIGGEKPRGICGSGLIDAVAELLDAGIVDPTGRLADCKAALDRKVHASLVERLRRGKNGNEFVLAFGGEDSEDVVLTQKDIRQVQLAKGAVLGGITSLLKAVGAGYEDIDRIIIAGAFGSYIKRESALRIGLLPAVHPGKVHTAGNAAGAGASMVLMSLEERRKAQVLAKKAVHLELAGLSDFQTEFINSMNFPPA